MNGLSSLELMKLLAINQQRTLQDQHTKIENRTLKCLYRISPNNEIKSNLFTVIIILS